MQVTKLKFTQEELDVLHNSHFFAVKLTATRKVVDLFGMLESELKDELSLLCNPEEEGLNTKNGKIFRGDNYRNLPYIVLDFPRLFNTTSIFAFRSMFWWANGFSFTLHLQGKAWEKRKKKLIRNLELLRNQGFYICVNESPWQYHFEKDNYLELDQFLEQGRKAELENWPFIKLSRRLDIDKHEQVINLSRQTFKVLMGVIS